METYLILITLAAIIAQFVMGFKVGTSRQRLGVIPPAITGNPEFERMFRAHQNMIEYTPMFLILLWIAGTTGANPYWVSFLGGAWLITRIVYFIAYSKGSPLRGKAFISGVLCLFLLLVTSLYNLIMM